MNNLFALNLFQFVAGLAVLILLHEFGHFLVARLLGVEIEEFGIGFPPRCQPEPKACNSRAAPTPLN